MKENYIQGLKIYHKGLEELIATNYNIQTEYLELLGWGYSSTALYVKSTDNQEYIVRIGINANEKLLKLNKDIFISGYIKDVIRAPQYIETKQGAKIITFTDSQVLALAGETSATAKQSNISRVLRVSQYLVGVPPFAMNLDIFAQAISMLKNMHTLALPSFDLPIMKPDKIYNQGSLLHGDLTPSNIIVSFDKVVALLDFEEASIGPVEWDLARAAFFSWIRMDNIAYKKVIETLYTTYKENIKLDLIYEFSKENANLHLTNVIAHEKDYETAEQWQQEREFIKTKIDELENTQN